MNVKDLFELDHRVGPPRQPNTDEWTCCLVFNMRRLVGILQGLAARARQGNASSAQAIKPDNARVRWPSRPGYWLNASANAELPMSQAREAHFQHWPPRVPRHLTLPQTNVFYNAEVSAARYPDKPFIAFYDTAVSFAEFKDEAERIAGFLQNECGVKAGDRELLYMQNSPQWVLAFYGILRDNAVVVPVNPMNRPDELRHYVEDCQDTAAFVSRDALPIRPIQTFGAEQLIVRAAVGPGATGKERQFLRAAFAASGNPPWPDPAVMKGHFE